jgi:ABC-type Fe3+/spermidine/putrescine transport system ATPase subunit
MLDRVGLGPPERDRMPSALSGGQQQRVALARALVIEPELLLLDEPLANLDRHLREQLRDEIRRLQRQTGVTTVLVTHDQDEALAVSDVVGVVENGRLQQTGSPAEVYHRPHTAFVARFVGEANLLDGAYVGGRRGQTHLVRPERCLLGPELPGCRWQWPGVVESVSFLGADSMAEVACVGGPSLLVRARQGDHQPGRRVTVGFPADAVWPIPETDPGGRS